MSCVEGIALRGLECLMLIGRDGVVREDVFEFLRSSTLRCQPGVDVLGL
jgi:hypothetical protein